MSPAARLRQRQDRADDRHLQRRDPDISLDTIDRLDSATAAASKAGITVAYGGPVIDFVQQQTAPQNHADEIGLLAAVIILIFVFGTIVAAILPLIIALTGVTIATLILTIIATGVTVGTVAPILGSMIGLGVGIDYSLLIVSRFRQERDVGVGVHDSIGRAIGTAGSASLFAGMCVAIALCGLCTSPASRTSPPWASPPRGSSRSWCSPR